MLLHHLRNYNSLGLRIRKKGKKKTPNKVVFALTQIENYSNVRNNQTTK